MMFKFVFKNLTTLSAGKWRCCLFPFTLILVLLLHMFFQDVLREIREFTIIALKPLVLKVNMSFQMLHGFSFEVTVLTLYRLSFLNHFC